MALDAEDEARIAALLRIEQYGSDVEPTDPQLAPESIGSAGAIAYLWPKLNVYAAVYRFGGYYEASAGEEQLPEPEGITTRSTVNGGLLLWLMGPDEDEPAADLIASLVESFAGEE